MSHALLTTNDLADLIGVSRWTIASWAKEGIIENWGIHPIKLGRRWLFKASEVYAFMGKGLR